MLLRHAGISTNLLVGVLREILSASSVKFVLGISLECTLALWAHAQNTTVTSSEEEEEDVSNLEELEFELEQESGNLERG
ncbi:Protein of unknown function [Gryllus bimaculatus]|nr:Protein of unknown function [Gryllus bimaculatus]